MMQRNFARGPIFAAHRAALQLSRALHDGNAALSYKSITG